MPQGNASVGMCFANTYPISRRISASGCGVNTRLITFANSISAYSPVAMPIAKYRLNNCDSEARLVNQPTINEKQNERENNGVLFAH